MKEKKKVKRGQYEGDKRKKERRDRDRDQDQDREIVDHIQSQKNTVIINTVENILDPDQEKGTIVTTIMKREMIEGKKEGKLMN